VARARIDLDRPTDALDIGAHDIHADPAAGNRGHRLRGRQARLEDQCAALAGRQAAAVGGVEQTGGDGLVDQPLAVDAAAVVDHVDHDLVARLAGRNGQQADLALARGLAVVRRLHAVVDGVSDDVG
jgi:hypothetical protein